MSSMKNQLTIDSPQAEAPTQFLSEETGDISSDTGSKTANSKTASVN